MSENEWWGRGVRWGACGNLKKKKKIFTFFLLLLLFFFIFYFD